MLKAVVTDINSVEEQYRGLYVEKDGKFFLNVTAAEGYELDNVQGLKSALGAERNLKNQLTDKLKLFEGLDPQTARQAIEAISAYGEITPDAAKKAIETAQRLQAFDPQKEADRIAQEKATSMLDQHKAQWKLRETELTNMMAQKDETVTSLTGQLQTLMRDNAIKSELAKLNPLDDARDAIELLAGNSVRTSIKDGRVSVEVVDDAGNPRIKDVNGTPFSVADLLAELKEKRPALFKADEKRGMGFSPNGGSGNAAPAGGKNPWAKETWNLTEQMKLTKSNAALAKQLKEQAGVS